MREKEDTTLNAFIAGFGNNSASLLAGLAIIPSVFALSASPEAALHTLQQGNQGLSFIAIPQLFATLKGAVVFQSVFFLGLFFAALSSLLAMFELSTRVFMDFGLPRKKALLITAGLTTLLGAPSAISLKIFDNQDWVWGLGLIISGGFFTFAVLHFGVERFRQRYLDVPANDLSVGRWFDYLLRFLIPVEVAILLGWWFIQSIQWYPGQWWNPLVPFSLGTCFLQWGILIVVLKMMNSRLEQWVRGQHGIV